ERCARCRPGVVCPQGGPALQDVPRDLLAYDLAGLARMPCIDHVVLDVDNDGRSHTDPADTSGQVGLDRVARTSGDAEARDRFWCAELLGFLGCGTLGRFFCPALCPATKEPGDEASDRTDAGADGRPDPGRNHGAARGTSHGAAGQAFACAPAPEGIPRHDRYG